MSPIQNIQENAAILRGHPAIPDSVINVLEKSALEHAKNLGF